MIEIQTPDWVSKTLPFLQKKADEVNFVINYSVSKNASTSIQSYAAHLTTKLIKENLIDYGMVKIR